ncbi:MAG: hypothetical protein K0S41_3804 [Anaerocolumna sp.]|jgi:hypothetical protein|nr:hypothetical protein [Anaerocolumna sp.]
MLDFFVIMNTSLTVHKHKGMKKNVLDNSIFISFLFRMESVIKNQQNQ